MNKLLPSGSFDDLPVCDVCNKPVDRVISDYNLFTEEIVYVAECHGEREVVKLETEILVAMPNSSDLRFGRAFTKKFLKGGSGERLLEHANKTDDSDR